MNEDINPQGLQVHTQTKTHKYTATDVDTDTDTDTYYIKWMKR